eukprot:2800686-Rhodomonas_salina.1
MLRITFSANTASLAVTLDSVGYASRSVSEEAVAPHTTTGVASTDAASANGPVTAERYEPTIACLPSSFHATTCLTATDARRHRRRRCLAEDPVLHRSVGTAPPQRQHHPHARIVPNALVLLLGRAPWARLALQRRARKHRSVIALQHLHRELPSPLPSWPDRRLAAFPLQPPCLPSPRRHHRQRHLAVGARRWAEVRQGQRLR